MLYTLLGKLLSSMLPPLPFAKQRVRVLVIHNSHILMIRNWYGYQSWTLPGGGVKRGELKELAALRELHEETGITCSPEAIRYLGRHPCTESKNAFEADFFVVEAPDNQAPEIQTKEILESSWWPISALPDRVGAPIDRLLQDLKVLEQK